MDAANDGDLEKVMDVYDQSENFNQKRELLEYTNQRNLSTALHLAANNGHAEIVNFIVQKIRDDF